MLCLVPYHWRLDTVWPHTRINWPGPFITSDDGVTLASALNDHSRKVLHSLSEDIFFLSILSSHVTPTCCGHCNQHLNWNLRSLIQSYFYHSCSKISLFSSQCITKCFEHYWWQARKYSRIGSAYLRASITVSAWAKILKWGSCVIPHGHQAITKIFKEMEFLQSHSREERAGPLVQSRGEVWFPETSYCTDILKHRPGIRSWDDGPMMRDHTWPGLCAYVCLLPSVEDKTLSQDPQRQTQESPLLFPRRSCWTNPFFLLFTLVFYSIGVWEMGGQA